jgi:hypothetical protein
MGTFVIKNVSPGLPVYVASAGAWVDFGANTKKWDVNDLPIGTTASITHTWNSPRIYLDGEATAYRWNEIPYTGVLITGQSGVSGSVRWNTAVGGALSSDPGFPITIDITSELFPLLASLTVQVSTEGFINVGTVTNVGGRYIPGPLATTQPPPSPIRLMGLPLIDIDFEIINIDIVHTSGYITHSYNPDSSSFGMRIFGDYTLWSTSLTMGPDPIALGDTITINDGELQLEDVEEVRATYIDNTTGELITVVQTMVTQTPGTITFALTGIPASYIDDVVIELFLGLTVGTVYVGALQVLLTDVSGIYTISPNKRNDTLYDRNNPGETIDVAIPTPKAKLGFIE